MKKNSFIFILASALFLFLIPRFSMGEHPGKSVTEHPGKAITADFVKNSIRQHVEAEAKAHDNVFTVHDDKLNKEWHLKLVKVHDPVRMFEKDGQTIYFACSDFKSLDSEDVLDVDFRMVQEGNGLEVIDTQIHKVNGEPRFTYEGITIKEVQ